MLDVASRVNEGLPIYTKPTAKYIPYIYAPLYFYVVGFLSKIFGLSFFLARLVSVLSISGVGIIIFLWLKKENFKYPIIIAGTGLFFATYQISARWFDLARVDSLFLFLLIAGLYIIRFYQNHFLMIFSGIIFFLAFLTKQMAIIPVVITVSTLTFIKIRRVEPLTISLSLITFLFLLGVFILVLASPKNLWAFFFIFELAFRHPILKDAILDFWYKDIFLKMPIVFLAISSCLFFFAKKHKARYFYASFLASMIILGYFSRLHDGGYINTLIPPYLAISLAVFLGYKFIDNNKLKITFLLAVIIQFYLLLYDPRLLIPNERNEIAMQNYLKKISKQKGNVLVPEIRFALNKYTKKTYGLEMALADLMRADLKGREYVLNEINYELFSKIRKKKFSKIIISNEEFFPFMTPYYKKAGYFHDEEYYFVEKRGALFPNILFVPDKGK